VDVRIVCATHQDLKQLTSEGRFREDLYYRLAEIVVNIPPLRARLGDASLLAHAFVKRFAQEQKRGSLSLSEDALSVIGSHSWPGNIREMENCIKRATIMAEGSQITSEDLDLPETIAPSAERSFDLRAVRDDADRKAVLAALAHSNNNVLKAAELLGISRPTLYDLMHKLGLK
jgi:two-component system NtrC family response regulator